MFAGHRTASASEFVALLKTTMFYTRTKSIPLLQMLFNGIRLYSYDARDREQVRKHGLKAISAGLLVACRSVSVDADLTQTEVLVNGKGADPSPRTTRKRRRRFLRGDVEEIDIIVVPDMFPKRSGNEQVLVPTRKATKNANTLKGRNKEKDINGDHPKGEKDFDGTQAAVLLIGTMKQAPLV